MSLWGTFYIQITIFHPWPPRFMSYLITENTFSSALRVSRILRTPALLQKYKVSSETQSSLLVMSLHKSLKEICKEKLVQSKTKPKVQSRKKKIIKSCSFLYRIWGTWWHYVDSNSLGHQWLMALLPVTSMGLSLRLASLSTCNSPQQTFHIIGF